MLNKAKHKTRLTKKKKIKQNTQVMQTKTRRGERESDRIT